MCANRSGCSLVLDLLIPVFANRCGLGLEAPIDTSADLLRLHVRSVFSTILQRCLLLFLRVSMFWCCRFPIYSFRGVLWDFGPRAMRESVVGLWVQAKQLAIFCARWRQMYVARWPGAARKVNFLLLARRATRMHASSSLLGRGPNSAPSGFLGLRAQRCPSRPCCYSPVPFVFACTLCLRYLRAAPQ